MDNKHRKLENQFKTTTSVVDLVCGATGLISGLAILLTPYQSVGYAGLGGSIAGWIAANTTKRNNITLAKGYFDSVFTQHALELVSKSDEIATLTTSVEGLTHREREFQALEQINTVQIQSLRDEVLELVKNRDEQYRAIEDLTKRLEVLGSYHQEAIQIARNVTQESLSDWKNRLLLALGGKKPEYELLAQRIEKFTSEVEETYTHFISQLEGVGEGLNTLQEIVSIAHYGIDAFANIKARFNNSVKTLRIQELEVYCTELEEQNEGYKTADVVPRQQYITLIKNYEARLQEFRVDLKNNTQQFLGLADELEREFTTDQDGFILELKGIIQRQEEQIRSLQTLLGEAKQIRYFDDVGWKSEVANKVLNHFSQHEIVCDACAVPIREVGGDLEFYITPRSRIGMNLIKADVEKAAEALQIPLNVKYVKITLEGKSIRVRIPFENREVKKQTAEDILARPVSTWLVYVGSEYHLVIFAATQSGKSSLADELNAMQHTQLEGAIRFRAITLKNDGNRDEEKTQRFVKPTFMADNQAYMDALEDIHQAIADRNQILQVNPNHEFPRQVFQLDEYGEYYRLGTPEEKSKGKEAVISLLQRGAGLSSQTGMGISLTLIAQNPYVSLLGLNKPDFANACIIIVGEKNIRLFLDSDPANHGLDTDDLERLKSELKVFKDASRLACEQAAEKAKAKGESVPLAIRKCPENYYSLVVPSKGGLPPVIVYNPKPGEFTNGLVVNTKREEKPTCPLCGTPSTRHRKGGIRYYCDNEACGRQTFTWKGLQAK